ncbi:MAG: hypothetical protein J6Q79_00495 [Clostridia bacterium]|nr:hypothetical protein [Clostridia bacterium]
MKNKKVIILLGVVAVAVAAVVIMVLNGVIVLDRSGERLFENGLRWKGNEYVAVSGKYKEGKTVAKTKDGLDINEVEGDDSHTFLVVRSFLDQWLVVRDDYEIPKSGKITKAYWSYQFIEDEEFLKALEEMINKVRPDFEYDLQGRGIYEHTDRQNMKELYIAFEGCTVPTVYLGYMGEIDGKLYLTTSKGYNDTVYCYTIPEEYASVFESYLS